MPDSLLERLRVLMESEGTSPAPLGLVPVRLEPDSAALRLRVSPPAAPGPSGPERASVWTAIVRRLSEWNSLQALDGISMHVGSP